MGFEDKRHMHCCRIEEADVDVKDTMIPGVK